jgi:hypothetical protein
MSTRAGDHAADLARVRHAVPPAAIEGRAMSRTHAYHRNRFVCEGCAAIATGRPLPDQWVGFCESALGGAAHWCATCQTDGTMDRDARPNRVQARAVARAHRRLKRLLLAATDATL